MEETKSKKKTRNQSSIVFPDIFTVEELNSLNPDVVEITLRYKINSARDRGILVQIGTIHRPVGRPHVVYGKAPIQASTIKVAQERGVKVHEDIERKSLSA